MPRPTTYLHCQPTRPTPWSTQTIAQSAETILIALANPMTKYAHKDIAFRTFKILNPFHNSHLQALREESVHPSKALIKKYTMNGHLLTY